MKFTVEGKDFYSQLSAASKVLNSKNAIQMLDNLLWRLEADRLFITGSDGENVMECWVEVFEVEKEGTVAVPAKRALEIFKEISNQPLKIEVSDNYEISVSYMGGEFSFMGVDASPFPAPAALSEDTQTLHLPAQVILKGLQSTLFAVSPEPVRPVMTGVFWDIKVDGVTFVASDTHKLVAYTNTTFAPGLQHSFVLHSKPAGVLKNLLSADEGEVTVTCDAKGASFNFGKYRLNCRLIKGTYPNYTRVIPKDNPYFAEIDRQSLLSALRRVAIFASKASMLIRFSFNPTNVEMRSQDLDYSLKANEKVACNYDGHPLVIGFRSDFTQEILSNIADDTVRIEICDPARPGLFLPSTQKEGEHLVMLQMPLQVIG